MRMGGERYDERCGGGEGVKEGCEEGCEGGV